MTEVLRKFDPYALVAPKTPADVLAILAECNNELDHLNELWEQIFKDLGGTDD